MNPYNPASVDLERFRNYLRILAQTQLQARLQGKVEASDIVQQTLVQAWQGLEVFRGRSEAELAGWLRQILGNCVTNTLRDWERDKRDVGREQSIHLALEQSSAHLASWLASDQTSPSQQAVYNDQMLRLADALIQLPEAQREAITLHHLSGWTLQQVSERMQRSTTAVAGLIKRGLKALREQLDVEHS
jgi:RNA polymerase sigma-70 factor, ECF subfamily